MKRILTFFTLIIIAATLLVSCGDTSDAPEGMQVVYKSAEDGYTFYGPEGWIISNRGGIAASYVSGINKTSISFAKTELAEGVAVDKYFDSVKDEFTYAITPVDEASFGKKCLFGQDNSTVAYKYIYTFKLTGKDTQDTDGDGNTTEEVLIDYTSMQIIVSHKEKVYIFTYTAQGTPDNESGNYRLYLEGAQAAIENFKFENATANTTPTPEYPKDTDGYSMVSDKSVAGFELYLSDAFTVVDNSAIVSAALSDGSNVSISRAREVGVTIDKYWESRKSALSEFATNLTVIAENKTNVKNETTGAYSSDITFGNLELNRVAMYEYTYDFAGETYHVYQLLGWTATDGYVFTYTAKAANFDAHLEDVMTVIEKVRF